MAKKYTLVGVDSNAFSILGYVISCIRNENKTKQEIEDYKKQATSGDYTNLLYVSQNVIIELNN